MSASIETSAQKTASSGASRLLALRVRASAIASAALFGALVTLFVWVEHSSATLYVYRLGGDDLPAPEFPAHWDAEFVPLKWSQIDDELFGNARLVDPSRSFMSPEHLDPAINITPTLASRPEGRITAIGINGWQREDQLALLSDADPNTVYDSGVTSLKAFGSCIGDEQQCEQATFECFIDVDCASEGQVFPGLSRGIWFDLGGLFPVSLIRIYPSSRNENHRFLRQFAVGTNDGDSSRDGARERRFYWLNGVAAQWVDYDVAHQSLENTTPVVELDMGGALVQNIFFESGTGDWEIAEFEIYGAGYAPSATYTSNIIDLGEPASLGNLTWSGARDDGTDVLLTTRSGDDGDPNLYWRHTFRGDERSRFDTEGMPLTREAYKKLEGGQRAGLTPDRESWGSWTPSLDFDDGVAGLAGDSPHQFVQFEVDFLTERPTEAGGRLDYIEFRVSKPPMVSQLLAEIDPLQANPGEATRFTYTLLPEFEAGDLGFDSIEIDTAAETVSVDTIILRSPTDAQMIDTLDVSALIQIHPDGFIIPLPSQYRLDSQSTHFPIEIIFRARVFRHGTSFAGRVFDRTREWEVHQPLTEGDANSLHFGNRLSVGLSEVRAHALRALRLSTPVFTPNGDGINDSVEITCELVNLVGTVPLSVGLFDLSGRKLVEMSGERTSGTFAETWDGTGQDGELLPPGIYLVRVELETDSGTTVSTTSVGVAY